MKQTEEKSGAWESVVFSGNNTKSSTMDYDVLVKEMQELNSTNNKLKEEVERLKEELGGIQREMTNSSQHAPVEVGNINISCVFSDDESVVSQLSEADRISTSTLRTFHDYFPAFHPVLEWLTEIDCDACYHCFLDNGINDVAKILNLKKSHLESMRIPSQMQKRILSHARRYELANPSHSGTIVEYSRKGARVMTLSESLWQPVYQLAKQTSWIWKPALVLGISTGAWALAKPNLMQESHECVLN